LCDWICLGQPPSTLSCRFPFTTYSCNERQGALLRLPCDGLHEDVIRTKVFEDYIRDHIDSWFSLAKRHGLGVKRMEDLILVTGCTLVSSWGVAAFLDDTQDSEVSLRSRSFNNDEASFEWRMARGSVAFQNSQRDRVRSLSPVTAKFTNSSPESKGWSTSESMCVRQRFSSKARLVRVCLCNGIALQRSRRQSRE
jgi:hypothetical protein